MLVVLALIMSRTGDFPALGFHVVDGLDDEVDLLVSVFFAGAAFDDDLVRARVHSAGRNDDTYY
jgi:hypothetical protein